MTTTPTPKDARRPLRLKEVTDLAYHLAGQIRAYQEARHRPFAATHLDQVEAVLADTREQVARMIADERDHHAKRGEVERPPAAEATPASVQSIREFKEAVERGTAAAEAEAVPQMQLLQGWAALDQILRLEHDRHRGRHDGEVVAEHTCDVPASVKRSPEPTVPPSLEAQLYGRRERHER